MMKRSNAIRIFILGIISWVIPFVISFFFYKRDGELSIPSDLFKSVMVVVAAFTGAYLLYRYFKTVHTDHLQNSVLVGLSWFCINLVLDILILLPILKVSFTTYFMSIGLRYLLIPIYAVTIGLLLASENADH